MKVLIAANRSLDKYQELWNNMVINDHDLKQIIDDAQNILKYRRQFEIAVIGTPIPWQFAGIIYYREDGLQFKGHPHNGDSLKKRTINEPSGRPLANPANKAGYTFMESFADLIALKAWHKVPVWNMPSLLYYFESNNGFGYRRLHHPINTPYLWSGTSLYKSGKFVSDGHYDATEKDAQMGAAPLLRYLTDKTLGIIK
jgi:lysozyme family protein